MRSKNCAARIRQLILILIFSSLPCLTSAQVTNDTAETSTEGVQKIDTQKLIDQLKSLLEHSMKMASNQVKMCEKIKTSMKEASPEQIDKVYKTCQGKLAELQIVILRLKSELKSLTRPK
jgi:hypothetical protein